MKKIKEISNLILSSLIFIEFFNAHLNKLLLKFRIYLWNNNKFSIKKILFKSKNKFKENIIKIPIVIFLTKWNKVRPASDVSSHIRKNWQKLTMVVKDAVFNLKKIFIYVLNASRSSMKTWISIPHAYAWVV